MDGETKQNKTVSKMTGNLFCSSVRKNIEIPPPSSPPFWLTLNSQRILRILIFKKKKKNFASFLL
jgi:hypothetical protein